MHHAHIQCTTEALSEVLQPDSRQQYGVKQPLTPLLVASVLVVCPYCVLATPLTARYRICQTTPEVSAAWKHIGPLALYLPYYLYFHRIGQLLSKHCTILRTHLCCRSWRTENKSIVLNLSFIVQPVCKS